MHCAFSPPQKNSYVNLLCKQKFTKLGIFASQIYRNTLCKPDFLMGRSCRTGAVGNGVGGRMREGIPWKSRDGLEKVWEDGRNRNNAGV